MNLPEFYKTRPNFTVSIAADEMIGNMELSAKVLILFVSVILSRKEQEKE